MITQIFIRCSRNWNDVKFLVISQNKVWLRLLAVAAEHWRWWRRQRKYRGRLLQRTSGVGFGIHGWQEERCRISVLSGFWLCWPHVQLPVNPESRILWLHLHRPRYLIVYTCSNALRAGTKQQVRTRYVVNTHWWNSISRASQIIDDCIWHCPC